MTLSLDEPWSPILGLRRMPNGPRYPIDCETGSPRMLLVGSNARRCDIVLRDDGVSDIHCLIEVCDSLVSVRDCNSKNGTCINGLAIERAQLRPGVILTVGMTSLLAYNDRKAYSGIVIPAASLHEFLHNAIRAHGSLHKAAKQIGVAYSTLQGWAQRNRFARPRASESSPDEAEPMEDLALPDSPTSTVDGDSEPTLDLTLPEPPASRVDG